MFSGLERAARALEESNQPPTPLYIYVRTAKRHTARFRTRPTLVIITQVSGVVSDCREIRQSTPITNTSRRKDTNGSARAAHRWGT
ncbi:predicted protein [Chaetomium globosum CBS 148.51]|uniref:Uncharacterized protein n=1 Tax=Chaetomium globosum (strain ATCC 6205 / CBS 148.51 / DSM 1962 / NBRC 6347 / NRRL 1970) TaxID=306901 RepID=Q2GLZ3_CHAGB|nr:uncharacterized protein CHGG_11063 [Chaetomium globosum CBS 148.51]EAQ82887.1 predicted protein [Chaetomium globosum CBS 148.51]